VTRFYLLFLLVPVWALGAILGGLWLLALPAVVFGLIPALDLVVGRDESGGDDQASGSDAPLWLWIPLQLGMIGVSVALADRLGPLERVLVGVDLGLLTGAGGITIAHELMHRSSARDRALAEILMTSVSYPWFCTEHVLGHHRNVGTLRDPATARFGESVYRFLPRTLVYSVLSFWELERARTARRGIPWWSLRDHRLRHGLALAASWTAVAAIGGGAGVALFAAQCAAAVLLLEVINYVEHYGLVREPGSRVEPRHSWNSRFWLTASLLFNLPRHADHHAHASRVFYRLRAQPEAPELPLGYATMVIAALFPPLWFWLMDARVSEARLLPSGRAVTPS
jgi:alkane 1-monooxygenase